MSTFDLVLMLAFNYFFTFETIFLSKKDCFIFLNAQNSEEKKDILENNADGYRPNHVLIYVYVFLSINSGVSK